MKTERLLNQIGEIDDRYIAEAAPAAKKEAKPRRIRWAAAAACLCLAGIGLFAAIRGGRPSKAEVSFPTTSISYRVELTSESGGDEQWDPAHVQLITADQGICLPASPKSPDDTGAGEVSLYVPPIEAPTEGSGEMSVEEAEEYAYLDLDSATEEMKEKILEARRTLIFHSSWVADGYSGNIVNVITGEVEPLPTFSELFPGWDLPVYDTSQEHVTQDGLGVNCLYGLELTVVQVADDFLRGAARKPMNRFDADQIITVYPPENGSMNTLDVKAGDSVFISYFGKNCSMSDSVIRAEAIEHTSPFDPEP